jgi:hypothetical protein
MAPTAKKRCLVKPSRRVFQKELSYISFSFETKFIWQIIFLSQHKQLLSLCFPGTSMYEFSEWNGYLINNQDLILTVRIWDLSFYRISNYGKKPHVFDSLNFRSIPLHIKSFAVI